MNRRVIKAQLDRINWIYKIGKMNQVRTGLMMRVLLSRV